MENKADLVEMTADIVSAYVTANQIATQDVPALIRAVHATLREVAGGAVIAIETSQEPAEVGIRNAPDDGLEEGHQRAPTPTHAWPGLVPLSLVHGSPHP